MLLIVAVYLPSGVQFFATPWTVAHQAPLSIGFPKQEYWSGLPFPSPEDLPDPRIKPAFPSWQLSSLPLSPDSKESACSAGDPGSIPSPGRSSVEGNASPFQYSCLENTMDREEPGGLHSGGHKEPDKTECLILRYAREALYY